MTKTNIPRSGNSIKEESHLSTDSKSDLNSDGRHKRKHVDYMFFSIATPLWNSTLNPTEMMMGGWIEHLARNTSNKHEFIFPSNKYIAELFGINERQVQRCLDALEKEGFIERVYTKQGSKTSRVIVVPEKRGAQQDGHVTKMSPLTRQKCHPSHDKNVTHNNNKINTSNTTTTPTPTQISKADVVVAVKERTKLDERTPQGHLNPEHHDLESFKQVFRDANCGDVIDAIEPRCFERWFHFKRVAWFRATTKSKALINPPLERDNLLRHASDPYLHDIIEKHCNSNVIWWTDSIVAQVKTEMASPTLPALPEGFTWQSESISQEIAQMAQELVTRSDEFETTPRTIEMFRLIAKYRRDIMTDKNLPASGYVNFYYHNKLKAPSPAEVLYAS